MARDKGFSLIEVLVVVLIVAVLTAAALPSYQQYVIRSKRVEAQAMLLALMQQQERYFTQHNSYIAFSATAAEPEARRFQWWSGVSAPHSAYELEGVPCGDASIRDCVQLVATPGTARVDPHFKDAACEKLILGSDGRQSATGPAPRCWP